MDQQRGSSRDRCDELLKFTAAVLSERAIRFVVLTGRAVNMSKSGLCFVTRYPLKSGSVLKFRNSAGRYCHCIVLWIRRLGDQYIAGAEVVDEVSASQLAGQA